MFKRHVNLYCSGCDNSDVRINPFYLENLTYTSIVDNTYHCSWIPPTTKKITKTKNAYPSDEALKKIIHLATMGASKKWTKPVKKLVQLHISTCSSF